MRNSYWSSWQNIFCNFRLQRCIILCLCFIYPIQKVFPQEYFQQKVSYKINVTLNDIKHELEGFESVQYINNSHDTLRFLYFHLWPNAYSDNKTELAKQLMDRDGKSKLFNDPELRGYIDSLRFEVGHKSIEWNLLARFSRYLQA